MKLGIPPPWSNTMFDVFLMNIAASAHGVYCWVIHVFGTWFSYEWWKSSKSKIFQCNVSFKGNITTQNRVGHYYTMVYNTMFDVFFNWLLQSRQMVWHCNIPFWVHELHLSGRPHNHNQDQVTHHPSLISVSRGTTQNKVGHYSTMEFYSVFYVSVRVFRFKMNHPNYVCIWNGRCILRI